ncbi:DsbA family oxidoreductase [Desulfovibrio cuneatus]|uniref:DsbA family oxidoreductase n=1 Tax=Desulfovibrio cuneatus TaxID=159728 RepID=UPI00146F95D2|nr:DsbA family protein [Desulfovibrio cuneatus]
MNTLQIEFFHDVVCSFCFPMSFHMRQLQAQFPNVEIIHRSFALVREEGDFVRMFGSREQAKNEILSHWESANATDDLHRFSIEGMRKQSFLFPASMKPLRACKAAFFVGGNAAYWDVFDALQADLFTHSKNIEEDAVIFAAVRNAGVDFDRWQELFRSEAVVTAVNEDLELARTYGIRSVPTLVVNKQHTLHGVVGLAELVRVVKAME